MPKKKWSFCRVFRKPEACSQTLLPDRSGLIGQKLVENAKIQMRHFGLLLGNFLTGKLLSKKFKILDFKIKRIFLKK